jgi:hypothetical protein
VAATALPVRRPRGSYPLTTKCKDHSRPGAAGFSFAAPSANVDPDFEHFETELAVCSSEPSFAMDLDIATLMDLGEERNGTQGPVAASSVSSGSSSAASFPSSSSAPASLPAPRQRRRQAAAAGTGSGVLRCEWRDCSFVPRANATTADGLSDSEALHAHVENVHVNPAELCFTYPERIHHCSSVDEHLVLSFFFYHDPRIRFSFFTISSPACIRGSIQQLNRDGVLKCEWVACGYMAARDRRPELESHIRTHTRIRPHQCEYLGCSESFPYRSGLVIHSRTHQPKSERERFVCTFAPCDKDYSSACNLARHVEKIHAAELPFACLLCGKRFWTAERLRLHARKCPAPNGPGCKGSGSKAPGSKGPGSDQGSKAGRSHFRPY